MTREVKAALAFVCLLVLAGLLLWLREDSASGAPPQSPAAPTRTPSLASGALAPSPSPREASSPRASASAPGQTSAPPRAPGRPASRAGGASPARSESPEDTDSYLSGRLIGPDGSPIQGEVYAFQTGAGVSLSFSEYDAPIEVEALARVLTRGQSGYLTSLYSDEAGRFRFRRRKLGDVEVVLVAATQEGAGGVRVPRGARQADLRLEARRPLRVVLVTRRSLAGAILSLELGEGGELPFPGLDEAGVGEVQLPLILPSELRLELAQGGWASSHRLVTPAEREAGLVTWALSADQVQISGRVLTPSGEGWAEGEVLLTFREDPESERTTWGRAVTDSEGNFACQGFPPGRPVEIEIRGSRNHGYYRAVSPASAAPLMIQLQKPSVLRIKVEGSEEDLGDFGLDWNLERRAERGWRFVSPNLYGRPNRFASFEEQELDHYFSLELGVTEVLGLPPGRYRISVDSFGESDAEPVEVELPPRGAASCVLRPKRKASTRFSGLLVRSGATLAKRETTCSYELDGVSVRHTFRLGAQGEFALEFHLPRPTRARLEVSDLRLHAEVLLDPAVPDLGTVVLEGR